MKNLSFIILVIVCTAIIIPDAAIADDVIVTVNLIPLQKGSLPTSITTYGRIVPSPKALETLSAQVSARVVSIEVREGERVKKGTPLVTLDPSPETRSSFKQAKMAFKVAKLLMARSRKLAAAHLETTAQLAQDEKNLADAKSALAALREEGANGPKTLTAPFDAVITNIAANSGSFVSQNTSVIELARPSGLVFRTGVVPAQASEVKNGDKAMITPFSGSGTFSGKVVLRGSIVSTQNGLVPIEISLPDNSMFTGEMGKVVINTGVRQGYIVPHKAVLLNTSGQTYIVQSIHDSARLVPVKVITSEGDKDLVQGDLVASEPLVGTGNYELDNGTRINAVSTSNTPDGNTIQ